MHETINQAESQKEIQPKARTPRKVAEALGASSAPHNNNKHSILRDSLFFSPNNDKAPGCSWDIPAAFTQIFDHLYVCVKERALEEAGVPRPFRCCRSRKGATKLV